MPWPGPHAIPVTLTATEPPLTATQSSPVSLSNYILEHWIEKLIFS